MKKGDILTVYLGTVGVMDTFKLVPDEKVIIKDVVIRPAFIGQIEKKWYPEKIIGVFLEGKDNQMYGLGMFKETKDL